MTAHPPTIAACKAKLDIPELKVGPTTKPGWLFLFAPLKTNMTLENLLCSIGNTSSNIWFSIMLVFGVVPFLKLIVCTWKIAWRSPLNSHWSWFIIAPYMARHRTWGWNAIYSFSDTRPPESFPKFNDLKMMVSKAGISYSFSCHFLGEPMWNFGRVPFLKL